MIYWNKLDIKYNYINYKNSIPKPYNLSEMCRIASILSKKFIFVRVDLFISNDNIYVGELTFFPENATGKIIPDSASKWLLTNLRESSELI